MIKYNVFVLLKENVRVLFILSFLFLFSSCSMSVLNEDSYGKKWENTFLWFNPNNLETIYTAKTGDFSKAIKIPNDSDYLIVWNKEDEVFNLSFTSYVHPIHSAYFEGFDASGYEEEIPFVIKENTYSITSNKLLPPDEGYYRISLSEDLTK